MSPTTDTRTGSAAARTVVASRRHNAAFWIVGYTFAVTMAFSALPTPLYVLYQTRDRFSTFMITVIFAAYAVGVVASLFLGSYIGLAIPVVGLGVATLWLSLPVSVLGLAVLLAAVILAAARRLIG